VVCHEIEDRAYRVGRGTLRASFQRLSKFEPRVDVFRALAEETDIDVHVYGVPGWTPPAIDGLTYHEDTDGDLERYWLLAFDSGDDTHASGLVAEQDGESYRGVWTDDPEFVDRLLTELEAF